MAMKFICLIFLVMDVIKLLIHSKIEDSENFENMDFYEHWLYMAILIKYNLLLAKANIFYSNSATRVLSSRTRLQQFILLIYLSARSK